MLSGRVEWEVIRTFDAASLTSSFQAFGTPFLYSSYICKVVNDSNVAVLLSNDGTNSKDIAPANGFWLYDEGKGSPYANQPALPAGTQISIKGTAGVGTIYLVTQYIVSQ